jgi:hypothetical protein
VGAEATNFGRCGGHAFWTAGTVVGLWRKAGLGFGSARRLSLQNAVRLEKNREEVMGKFFKIGVALFAFIAAGFWFASAAGELPIIRSYWDSVPANDPYYMAVKFSALMNRWAALFSGLSALCAGASIWVK